MSSFSFNVNNVSSQGSRTQQSLKALPLHSNKSTGLVGISSLDDSCDLTNLKLRSNNIIIILLHQDPIDSSKKLANDHSLADISDVFFEGIAPFSSQNLFGDNGEDARKELASFCSYDHIRSVHISKLLMDTVELN